MDRLGCSGSQSDDAGARRALAIAYTTITPNFVVVGIDKERAQLVYHQIKQSPIPTTRADAVSD